MNELHKIQSRQPIISSKKFYLILTTIILSVLIAVITSSVWTSSNSHVALALQGQEQPNINASNVYNTHRIILPYNIKNLIITIPNEAHEPPGLLPRDLRVANQPFFPQNAVVNVGTLIVWFNGDVGHLHQIKLADNSNNIIYDSGTFPNFVASKSVKLNNSGTFTFSEAGLDKKYPNFKLNGTLIVVNQQVSSVSGSNKTASSTSNNVDTIVPFMVPTNQQGKLISEFKSQGFSVDNAYTFKTPRGVATGEGCGDKNQSLLILTSTGKDLNQVISTLKQITPTMPCT